MKKQSTKSITQNGITLIALIITIIVMLILVGVTVNIAIKEDGLISNAQQAAKSTKKVKLDEEISIAVVSAYDEINGKTDIEFLETNLGNIQEGISRIERTDDSFPVIVYYENEEYGSILINEDATVTYLR